VDKNVKQVIVIRKDLKMRRGKEIAQGAHAAMKWLTKRLSYEPFFYTNFHAMLSPVERSWVENNFKKVCLRVDSEEELLALQEKAKKANLLCELVTDRGLTEFDGIPTHTCLGIGPDLAEKIDQITGDLKLY